jgi:tetratricopeptide (TPR) repeat protein
MNKIYTYRYLKTILKKFKAGDSAKMQNSIDNDFLRDAMQGYSKHPKSFKQFPRILKGIYKQQGLHLGFSYVLTKAIYTIIIAVSVWFAAHYINNNNAILEEKTSYSMSSTEKEIEISKKYLPEVVEANEYISQETTTAHVYNITHERFSISNIPLSDPEIPFSIDSNLQNIQLKIIFLEEFKVIDYRYPKNAIPFQTISNNHGLDPMHENYENKNENGFTDLLSWEIIPYKEYLSMPLLSIHSKEYDKALQYFNIILKQYPSDLNAWFYSSYVHFQKGNYSKALEGFSYVSNKDNECFDQEAIWYMALCFEKLNQQGKADKIFTEIVSEEGFYSEAANNKLNLKP